MDPERLGRDHAGAAAVRRRGAYLSDKRADGLPVVTAVSPREYEEPQSRAELTRLRRRDRVMDDPAYRSRRSWVGQTGRYLQAVAE